VRLTVCVAINNVITLFNNMYVCMYVITAVAMCVLYYVRMYVMYVCMYVSIMIISMMYNNDAYVCIRTIRDNNMPYHDSPIYDNIDNVCTSVNCMCGVCMYICM
jgi:hypothetical protein